MSHSRRFIIPERVSLVLLLTVLAVVSKAQTDLNESQVRFEAGVGWTLGTQATEFITDYQGVLGGSASSFGIPVGGRASIHQYVSENLSVGLSGGFFRASIRESYVYDPQPPAVRLGPKQAVIQNIEVTAAPAYAVVDYYAGRRQFTGYFGAGVGLLFGNVLWTEDIQPSQLLGARTGGTRYNASIIAPAFMLRTGVSLGFDGPENARSLNGIRVDVSYAISPLRGTYMSSQFDSFAVPPPERLKGSYAIDPGGVRVEIGFFILLRQRPTATKTNGRM
ncbi:MAG: hypothetical protein FGM32_03190 [Candidatus Kapabacteria bacterium]|nr:hypothetical protein [Candidatus Kapabacteria bacterium]